MCLGLLYSLYFILASVLATTTNAKRTTKKIHRVLVQPVCLSFCFTSSAPDSHEEDLLLSGQQAPGGCNLSDFK